MKKFIPFLLLSLSILFTSAQWTDDTTINTEAANGGAGDMQSISTSAGRTYIAFWHGVDAPAYYEMRLQIIDDNGNKTLGDMGMVVNNVVAMSSYTVTFSTSLDSEDNLYIGFTGTGDSNQAYVHKIAQDGTQLWGPQGVQAGTGYDVKVLPLSTGEAIVAWLPGNQGVMQKFNSTGIPQWPAEVTIEPLVSGHKTSAGEMAEYSNGDFCVVYHDRAGFSPSSSPFAQRYTQQGNPVWASQVALNSNISLAFNRRYSLVQDGDILYLGYSGSQGSNFLSFIQRINPDGTLPFGTNGSDFSIQSTNYEMETWIAFQPGSNVIWGLCTFTNTGQNETGEYIQKWNKATGERLLGENAKEVFPINANYIVHQGRLQLANNQPLFVISNGNSNGVFVIDLLAVYLDANGDFVWPDNTMPVCTNANAVKSRINLCSVVGSSAVCAWTDNRNTTGEPWPFAQRISLGCLPPTASFEADLVEGFTYTFTSTAIGAMLTEWSLDGLVEGTSNTITYTFSGPGTHELCLTVTNECGTSTYCETINVTIGIEELLDAWQLQVFPNPVNSGESLNLHLNVKEATNIIIGVYGADGRLVLERKLNMGAGSQNILLDNAGIASGLYTIRINLNDQTYARSLVIK